MSTMARLTGIVHLLITTSVAYHLAPILVLGGLAGYFPGFSRDAYTATYVVIAVAAAFLAGTILGRTRMWRRRIAMLSGLFWVLALAVSVPAIVKGRLDLGADELIAPIVLDLATVFLAIGMTAGLFVGARYMRPYEPESTPAGNSQARTGPR